jgi:hypothetical protein
MAAGNQNVPTIEAKILLGWMERNPAVAFLREQCIFDRALSEDEAEAIWHQYSERVNALPERPALAPQRLQLTPEERRLADAFMQFHRQFGPTGSVKDVIKIDPTGLVAYQPHVIIEQSGKYRTDAHNAATFAQHSLAVIRGQHQLQLNCGVNAADAAVPHGEFMFVFNQQSQKFEIMEQGRHVSVTAFQNRMLLWAGYHRSYARIENANPDGNDRSLLVALTTDGDFLVSPQSPNHGLRAMVCGLRPALLGDFLDDALFMRVNLKRKRFVLQIRAACVPVDL